MIAESLIATPETDARLAKEYRLRGAAAKKAGKPRSDALSGMVGHWWLQGYDAPELAGGPAEAL
jgi:hypothetical protein